MKTFLGILVFFILFLSFRFIFNIIISSRKKCPYYKEHNYYKGGICYIRGPYASIPKNKGNRKDENTYCKKWGGSKCQHKNTFSDFDPDLLHTGTFTRIY